jgi:hypothetical protein
MALSFPEKQAWVSALEAVVQDYNNNRMEGDNGQHERYLGNTLVRLDKAERLDLNCCLQLSPEVLFSLWAILLMVHFVKLNLDGQKLKQLRIFVLT